MMLLLFEDYKTFLLSNIAWNNLLNPVTVIDLSCNNDRFRLHIFFEVVRNIEYLIASLFTLTFICKIQLNSCCCWKSSVCVLSVILHRQTTRSEVEFTSVRNYRLHSMEGISHCWFEKTFEYSWHFRYFKWAWRNVWHTYENLNLTRLFTKIYFWLIYCILQFAIW